MFVDIILNILLSFIFVWGFIPIILSFVPIHDRYLDKGMNFNEFDI